MWRDLFLRAKFGPRLQPGRFERVLRRFDDGRGYGAYHELCRERLSRTLSGSSDELAGRGFESFQVLSASDASGLVKELQSRFPVDSASRRRGKALRSFQIEDHEMRDRILAAVLAPAVDQRVARHFGSEYLVHWYSVVSTEPGGGTESFRWHCDRGPSAHLKLLVYLNDSVDHGGATEFIDLPSTRRVAERGYLFGPSTRRSDDLAWLEELSAVPLSAHRAELVAGEGVLFQPSRVLHRGVRPTRAARYVVAVCLLPSPVPWREALVRGAIVDRRRDRKWPRSARSLTRRLS